MRRWPSLVTVGWVLGLGVGVWVGRHLAGRAVIGALDWLVIAALVAVSALLLGGQPRSAPPPDRGVAPFHGGPWAGGVMTFPLGRRGEPVAGREFRIDGHSGHYRLDRYPGRWEYAWVPAPAEEPSE